MPNDDKAVQPQDVVSPVEPTIEPTSEPVQEKKQADAGKKLPPVEPVQTSATGSSRGYNRQSGGRMPYGNRGRMNRSGNGYNNGNGNGNSHGYNNGSSSNTGFKMKDIESMPSDGDIEPSTNATEPVAGYLDTSPDGHGVLRPRYSPSRQDVYISTAVIRRLGLRPGDHVTGIARVPKESERYYGLQTVDTVNDKEPVELRRRPRFEDLTPVYPNNKLKLETSKEPLSTRLIDIAAPVGRGQRGMIVSPPKAGKTTIMKEMATGIAANYPEIHLMAVLIGERPEEVTDIRRHIESITNGKGEVAASNFDEPAEEQTRIAELALERAKRLAEVGQDVVILLDSITRLARAYNLAIPTSGRTLSGGFDPAALYPPKRFFGAARNFEGHGSLTIIGTALVETGSRMDDLIYEEFKGTGNMELVLDRSLAERRIFPSIDVQRSGTRREDLLFTEDEYSAVNVMRRMLDVLGKEERTQLLVDRLKKTNSNTEFLGGLKEG